MEIISVIIPVYNVQSYLHTCVDSVLAQTYPNLQIILVDDGSVDGSGAICDQYADRDARIQVIHKANGGLSDARNAGLEVAGGKYISFVDADDYLAPDMIGKLWQKAEAEQADMVLCGYALVDDAGSCQPEEIDSGSYPVWPETAFWNYYYQVDSALCVVAWNKIYRRELFDGLAYEKGRYHEDEFMLDQLLSRCRQVSCVPEPLYYYRQRTGSIMHNRTVTAHLDLIDALLIRSANALQAQRYGHVVYALQMVFEEMLAVHAKQGELTVEMREQYRRDKRQFTAMYGRAAMRSLKGLAALHIWLYIICERLYFRCKAIYHRVSRKQHNTENT